MINELLFFLHAIIIVFFTLFMLRLGPTALSATVCLYVILSNMLVTKQIMLLGFPVVTTDVFAVGCLLGLNMLQEYYGQKVAQKTIFLNIILSLFYVLVTRIHLIYVPSQFDIMQNHFVALLSPMPRIIIASLISYAIVQYLDSKIYGRLKGWLEGRFLGLRNLFSLSISQFLDTIIFSVIGLWGIVHALLPVMIFSFCIKMIVVLCLVPFSRLSRYFVKVSQP